MPRTPSPAQGASPGPLPERVPASGYEQRGLGTLLRACAAVVVLSILSLAYLAWEAGHGALLGLACVTLLSCAYTARRLNAAWAQFSQAAENPARQAPEGAPAVVAPGEPGPEGQSETVSQHAQRLEVVGRLAGGIAHDFNNTLTVILSYGELLKARLGQDHALAELADNVVQAAEHGAALTKQLLTFTRRQVSKPRPVDLGELLRSTERALKRVIPRSIRVHHNEGEDELFVRIDALQLQQAILNLVLNARDAMPAGGDLYLEVVDEELRAGNAVGLVPGTYVVLRVRDTGTGIAPDVLSHMFEPFFTTKAPGRGTGLGLSNVRDITEAAGGKIAVRSELGKGSEFALYFPRVDAHVSGVLSRIPEQQGGRASILVVDDDPQIREVIRTILCEANYHVTTAGTAHEALAALRGKQPVDLVCTDLIMPDMSGARLIDELRAVSPSVPVVLCSAYGSDSELSRRVARGEAAFLAKPFTQRELLDLVERSLSPGRARTPASAQGRPKETGAPAPADRPYQRSP